MARPPGKAKKRPSTDAALRRLGLAIRAAREARGWTLDGLAEETGLGPAYIARVEGGRVNLTFRSLDRIAEGLGVEIVKLLAR